MKQLHYINLTNGIEAIPNIEGDIRFIRLQSTACEQKRWDFILQDLDNDFYMQLAIGNECFVYDFGARKNISRAIYQGIEFLRYVLECRWYGRDYRPSIRRSENSKIDCENYFKECYWQLEDRTLKKLDYFKKFLISDEIKLHNISQSTVHDGDNNYYRDILRKIIA